MKKVLTLLMSALMMIGGSSQVFAAEDPGDQGDEIKNIQNATYTEETREVTRFGNGIYRVVYASVRRNGEKNIQKFIMIINPEDPMWFDMIQALNRLKLFTINNEAIQADNPDWIYVLTWWQRFNAVNQEQNN